jgi:hypothetical protein
MNRISINAQGQPYFELASGQASYDRTNKTWRFFTPNSVLIQAVSEGYAKETIEQGTYGKNRKWFTNDGKLIREFYTDDTQAFDTWNSHELDKGIFNLTKEGAYDITFDDIKADTIARRKNITTVQSGQ